MLAPPTQFQIFLLILYVGCLMIGLIQLDIARWVRHVGSPLHITVTVNLAGGKGTRE